MTPAKPKRKYVTKRDFALGMTIITTFVGVIRYGEKKIDTAEANAKSFVGAQVASVEKQISIERDQRQKDIQLINGKLDTITRMLLEMRSGR